MEEKNQNIQLSEKIEHVRQSHRLLRKKSAMLMLTGSLVVVVLAALTIAWYTRVANTYSVTFDVADYDLTMNENVDQEYLLNVYDYSQVTNQKMAPGTIGWIPLEISAYHSDVEVEYFISLDSKIPENLRNHLRFFVLKDSQDKYVYRDTNDKFSTVAKLDSYTKVVLTPSINGTGNATVIQDTIKLTDAQKTKTLYIFWEWFLDADTAATAGVITKSVTTTAEQEAWNTLSKAWDDLDTDVGRYPDKYYDAFTVYIKTMGTQVKPENGVSTRPANGTVTP